MTTAANCTAANHIADCRPHTLIPSGVSAQSPSDPPPAPARENPPPSRAARILITAGPTHEPIDRVRYLGNRSSGRLGVDLAAAAHRRGAHVTLLLGPTPLSPPVGESTASPGHTPLTVHRFQTTADLEALLIEHFPACDLLIMAAAVADWRPAATADRPEKLTRATGRLTLELEATPDLLAGCAARRRPGQRLVGFALEPRDRLIASARRKLERKRVDLIVANPLETMDAGTIEATLVSQDAAPVATPGPINKARFADWLLDHLGVAAVRV